MLKKDFDKFLSIKAKEQKNTSKIDWEREKNEWIEHLENLYHIFEEALQDGIIKWLVREFPFRMRNYRSKKSRLISY